jgi:hypothetical protein
MAIQRSIPWKIRRKPRQVRVILRAPSRSSLGGTRLGLLHILVAVQDAARDCLIAWTC